MSVPPGLLPELPALLVIAEELHFGRAADRLNISQPRVSQIVRRIEDIVGYEVFVRRPQVRLTPAGEHLTKAARDALDQLSTDFTRAAELAAGRRSTVRLGYSPVAMLTPLPRLLRSARRMDPGLSIELHEDDTANLWDGLEAGRFDIIVTREARNRPGIANHLFLLDDMVAALPVGKAIREPANAIAELRDHDIIMIDESISPEWHRAMVKCCQSAGFDPKITFRVNDWPATLALVANGLGGSIVSSTLAKAGFPGVMFVPIANGAASSGFWIAYRDVDSNGSIGLVRQMLTDENATKVRWNS